MIKLAGHSGFRWPIALALAVAIMLSVASIAGAQSADDQYGTPVAPAGPLAGEPVTVLNDTDGVVGPGDVLVIEGDYVIADGASVTLQDSDGTQGTLIDDQNAVITEGSVVITVTDFPIINVPGANGVLNTDGLFVVATTGIALADDETGAAPGMGTGETPGTGTGTAPGTGTGATPGTGTGAAPETGSSASPGTKAGAAPGAEGGAAPGAAPGAGDAASAGDAEDSRPETALGGVLPDTGGVISLVALGAAALVGTGLLALRRLRNH